MNIIDIIVIFLYLAIIVGIGVWVGLKGGNGGEGKSYFLAGGNLTWPLIGLALFSTNISTIHLVGFAQEGYENGLAYGTLFQGINTIISYMAPPITVVFVFGVFWKKASAKGAVATLILGSVLGLMVFLLDWLKESTGWSVPFLLSAFYLFLACSVIMIMVSSISPHEHTAESEKLVWRSPVDRYAVKHGVVLEITSSLLLHYSRS